MRKPKRIENPRDPDFYFTRQAVPSQEVAQVWVVNDRLDGHTTEQWYVELEGLPRLTSQKVSAAVSRLIQIASSWCRRLILIGEREP